MNDLRHFSKGTSVVEAKSIGYFRFSVKKDVSLSNGMSSTGHKGQLTGAWSDDQFFGLTGQLVSLFAELSGRGISPVMKCMGRREIHLAADFAARTGPLLCAIACRRRESTHLQRLRAVLWNRAVCVPDLPSLERTVR